MSRHRRLQPADQNATLQHTDGGAVGSVPKQLNGVGRGVLIVLERTRLLIRTAGELVYPEQKATHGLTIAGGGRRRQRFGATGPPRSARAQSMDNDPDKFADLTTDWGKFFDKAVG